MLHNPFTEAPKPTGSGTATMNKTTNTSACLPPRMITPTERINLLKQRMTSPTTTRQTIEINAPMMDPTVRKKPRYEHSLSRIVR